MLPENAKEIYFDFACAKEFDDYYSSYSPDTQILMEQMERIYAEMQGEPAYRIKERQIAYLCDNCRVHLFAHCDFFFEMSSGRERHTWGGLQSPVGIDHHCLGYDTILKEGF